MMWSSAKARNRPDLKTRTVTVDRSVSMRRSSAEAGAAEARPQKVAVMSNTFRARMTFMTPSPVRTDHSVRRAARAKVREPAPDVLRVFVVRCPESPTQVRLFVTHDKQVDAQEPHRPIDA